MSYQKVVVEVLQLNGQKDYQAEEEEVVAVL